MDDFSLFVLAVLTLFGVAAVYRRSIKYRALKRLIDEEYSPEAIEKIMRTFKE